MLQTIGQAYDDMQTQNQQLLQQITERDDYNIKVISQENHSLFLIFILFYVLQKDVSGVLNSIQFCCSVYPECWQWHLFDDIFAFLSVIFLLVLFKDQIPLHLIILFLVLVIFISEVSLCFWLFKLNAQKINFFQKFVL